MAAGMQVKTTWTCRHLYLALLLIALVLMLADYFFVYVPLQRMTAAVEQARPADFDWYHTSIWSQNRNLTIPTELNTDFSARLINPLVHFC